MNAQRAEVRTEVWLESVADAGVERLAFAAPPHRARGRVFHLSVAVPLERGRAADGRLLLVELGVRGEPTPAAVRLLGAPLDTADRSRGIGGARRGSPRCGQARPRSDLLGLALERIVLGTDPQAGRRRRFDQSLQRLVAQGALQ